MSCDLRKEMEQNCQERDQRECRSEGLELKTEEQVCIIKNCYQKCLY